VDQERTALGALREEANALQAEKVRDNCVTVSTRNPIKPQTFSISHRRAGLQNRSDELSW
jgi:hypothetical protein